MQEPGHNSEMTAPVERVIVLPKANSSYPLKGGFERMARRRHQNPKPVRRGEWWTLRVWKDTFTEGEHHRTRERIRLAPATIGVREVQKIADEYLRPLNQGLETIGSATNFRTYVENTYRPVVMPGLAKSTQSRTDGVLNNYLLPAFGDLCLRDLSRLAVQRYFSEMASSPLTHESKDKIRDVLSSVLASAVDFGLIVKNPVEAIRMPKQRAGRRRSKPYVTPDQFAALLTMIAEPYASMIYVAVYTGLRISELCALRWRNVHESSISIEERFCRGDWGAPKSEASNATIAVNGCVISRIERLKTLTVDVKAGTGTRKYKLVKAEGPDDLVFQSVKDGKPMRDNNILTRHIKPAARKLGLDFINWRCLRTSHATWLKLAGADVKDAQAQMRHSRASTTLDIYQQFVPESQQRVVDKLSSLSTMIQ
jgi:integrase